MNTTKTPSLPIQVYVLLERASFAAEVTEAAAAYTTLQGQVSDEQYQKIGISLSQVANQHAALALNAITAWGDTRNPDYWGFSDTETGYNAEQMIAQARSLLIPATPLSPFTAVRYQSEDAPPVLVVFGERVMARVEADPAHFVLVLCAHEEANAA